MIGSGVGESDREEASQRPRQQTIDDVLGPSGQRDIRRLPSLMVQAFRLVWEASPRQLLLAGGLQIAAGLSLAGQLLVVRRVLGQIGLDDGMPDVTSLAFELSLFGVLLVIVATAGVAQREQQRLLTEEVTKYTTGHVMDVATSVDLIEFDRPSFYDRLERARVNASVRPLQIAQGVIGLLGAGAAVAAVGATLALIEPLVGIVIVIGGIPAVILNRMSARALHAYTIEQTPGDRRRSYLFQTLSRKEEAQEVRAFDSQSFLREEHDRIFDQRIAATHLLVRKRLLYGVASGLVAASVTVGSIVLLFVLVQVGRLSLADAAVAIGAVIIVAGRIRGLIASTGSLYEGALFLSDFTDFVEAGRRQAVARAARSELRPFETIRLEEVSFTYPSRTEPSLVDVSLELHEGEVLALVGENGSGKTTLTKLLAGLYRPTSGHLLWDEVDQTEQHLGALRNHVTVIFQDFARYFLTAHENISISDHRRGADRAAVEVAAERAGILGFLSRLPRGLDTLLGPSFVGGSDLSLGQWQRIALARAYFRDTPLLILDEPTASLDPRGEFEIFQQVRRLAAGHTVILVSHRFSNVRIADRILVMDAGRIVEVGSHEELLAADGLYAELFELQARGYRPDQ